MNIVISPATSKDVDSIKSIIDSTELFPPEMLDDMMRNYLQGKAEQEMWLVANDGEHPVGVCFCAPEPMTDGTCNLYMIAVHKEIQARGVGSQLMKYVEDKLRAKGVRVLIVETAGTNEFVLTRKFYDKLSYTRVGQVPDFYSEGEDKIIFHKSLVETSL